MKEAVFFFNVKYLKVGKGFKYAMNEPCSAGTFPLRARGGKQYLQVGVVDRERGTEETLDNGHHRLCHILLQRQICVVTVCGRVTHLNAKIKHGIISESTHPHVTSLLFPLHMQ